MWNLRSLGLPRSPAMVSWFSWPRVMILGGPLGIPTDWPLTAGRGFGAYCLVSSLCIFMGNLWYLTDNNGCLFHDLLGLFAHVAPHNDLSLIVFIKVFEFAHLAPPFSFLGVDTSPYFQASTSNWGGFPFFNSSFWLFRLLGFYNSCGCPGTLATVRELGEGFSCAWEGLGFHKCELLI